ncbi:hypothetical protein LBMAG40_12030 [Cyanobium sp.]|nr:hypothetical protein LBMAG40_12030 [Cyanobium sp.]
MTLSGGEAQRIRLASQIGAGLTGVFCVLDEPSIGLHQRDNDRLLATLNKLRDLGNTLTLSNATRTPSVPPITTCKVSPGRRIKELPLSWAVTIRVWLLGTGSGAAGLAGVALAETASSAVRSRGAGAFGAWNRFGPHRDRGRHEPQNNIGLVRRWGSA